MLLSKNNRTIENILKQKLHSDRAKIQVGNISNFGLLEMSRQRLRPSIYEAEFVTCPHCLGHGRIRSLDSLTLKALHKIEKEATNYNEKSLSINIPKEIAIHILNNKRKELSNIEEKRNLIINIVPDAEMKYEDEIYENNSANESKTKENTKKETTNKPTNKTKRPYNKNKFKKFNSKSIDEKEDINEGDSLDKINKNIKNKKEESNIQIDKQENNKNKKSISRTSTSNNKKPRKNSTKAKKPNTVIKEEKAVNDKEKKTSKPVKARKKGPAKKGWWNKSIS